MSPMHQHAGGLHAARCRRRLGPLGSLPPGVAIWWLSISRTRGDLLWHCRRRQQGHIGGAERCAASWAGCTRHPLLGAVRRGERDGREESVPRP